MLTQATKGKHDKQDFIKNLKFCFSKDTAKIMKREATGLEKILKIIYLINMQTVYVSRTYKKLSKFNNKEIKNSVRNAQKT